MIILTVILCVLLLPILYLALPFLATYIPLQIISFFASIIEYFKEIFREFFPKTSNDSNKVSDNPSEPVQNKKSDISPSVTSTCVCSSYKLYFTYRPENIEGDDLSDFDKERIAVIMSIIEPGVSKYLGYSKTVLVDYNFFPLNKSSDLSYDKSIQARFLSLNRDLKKYGLSLWVNDGKPVLSIPVSDMLSIPSPYYEDVLSYNVTECGLRIDFT